MAYAIDVHYKFSVSITKKQNKTTPQIPADDFLDFYVCKILETQLLRLNSNRYRIPEQFVILSTVLFR